MVNSIEKKVTMKESNGEGVKNSGDIIDNIKRVNRQLASTEPEIRDAALAELSSFLKENENDLDELKYMMIWRGLFYSFWLCDKPINQQNFSLKMAEITLELSSKLALLNLKCFWNTMSMDWPHLDKHRIDKYYLLVRRFVNVTFQLLKKYEFDNSCIESVFDIYKAVPFNTEADFKNIGLQYHVIDIYWDELVKVLPFGENSDDYPLDQLLLPIIELVSHTKNKVVISKTNEMVFDKLINAVEENLESKILNKHLPKFIEECFNRVTKPNITAKVRKAVFPLVVFLSEKFNVEIKMPEVEEKQVKEIEKVTTPVSKKVKKTKVENQTNKQGQEQNKKNYLEYCGLYEEDYNSKQENKDDNESICFSIDVTEVDDYTPEKENNLDNEDSCISTADFYVEDLSDPIIASIALGTAPPVIKNGAQIKKKVRWVLDRNQTKVFDKTSSLGDINYLQENKKELKSLLKPSSLPILIDHNKLKGVKKLPQTDREKRSIKRKGNGRF